MIYFLHGPDTYRSRLKLAAIIVAFRGRAAGAANVTRLDAAEASGSVREVGRSPSLFSAKQLVVLERVSEADVDTQRTCRERLPAWSRDPDLTVVFWEADVAVRGGFPAAIAKRATKTQTFELLAAAALQRWVAAAASQRSIRLAPAPLTALIERWGGDLWAMVNELDKVASGWSPEAMAAETASVWDFTDAFLGHRPQSFHPLETLLRKGEEPLILLGALAAALRNVALVHEALAAGRQPKPAGVHPFVARKLAAIAPRFDRASLAECFGELVATDAALKTGSAPPPLPLVRLALR